MDMHKEGFGQLQGLEDEDFKHAGESSAPTQGKFIPFVAFAYSVDGRIGA